MGGEAATGQASARVHRRRGVAAVTLSCGELQATFVPEMTCWAPPCAWAARSSWRCRAGIGAYRRVRTTGLPLLAPWDNRLSGRAYRAEVVRPSSDRAVPISFGYHPYLRLPGGRRPAWRLLLPRRRHVELDKRGIPTGRSTEEPAEAEPIGARTSMTTCLS